MIAIYQQRRYVVPHPADGEPLRWHPEGRPEELDLVPLVVERIVWLALQAGALEVPLGQGPPVF